MPGQLKEAMVRPKLKKESLDLQEYLNFHPIFNLKFVSKIIEWAIALQVKNYISDNNLDESLQSAYKHLHGTETALVKVQNDILCAIDDNKGAALLLYLTLLVTDFPWIECAITLVWEDRSWNGLNPTFTTENSLWWLMV